MASEVSILKKKFQKYTSILVDYSEQLEKILPKLQESSFIVYQSRLKPDIDKILFTLTNIEMNCSKIHEDKKIKKHLRKEYQALQDARVKAKGIIASIEANIPQET